MIKIIKNEYFLAFLLFLIFTSLTLFQSIYQDYTSVIDFDLTVIHNSLQLVSNKYPDFRDLTSYSHFLTYGIFYKIFSFFDKNLITNIEQLVKFNNPEIILQKLYVVSRITNSSIHFITIVFFYKLMGIFYNEKYYKVLSVLFLIISQTFLANFTILRSDIVALCYFFMSTFFLFDFVKNEKKINLFFVSFFMMLSLLAKVQIIFLFLFIFLFFVFYIFFEKKNFYQENIFYYRFIQKYSKYFLLVLILLYFVFQIYLNNFVNSSSGVGYLDFFCFAIYFLILSFFIQFVSRASINIKEYLYYNYFLIIVFLILNISFLFLLKTLNIIKIDFNIIFSITNPFYFLKIYSPFSKVDFSFFLIYEMIVLFFKKFNFNLIYTFWLLVFFLFSFIKILFLRKSIKSLNKLTYIFLLGTMTCFLVAINNFRTNVFYNIYAIPLLFLISAIFFNLMVDKKKIIFCLVFSISIAFNFMFNLNNLRTYIYKPSNLNDVCLNKSTRDFYYNWARSFNEDFFKKICFNSNYKFN